MEPAEGGGRETITENEPATNTHMQRFAGWSRSRQSISCPAAVLGRESQAAETEVADLADTKMTGWQAKWRAEGHGGLRS